MLCEQVINTPVFGLRTFLRLVTHLHCRRRLGYKLGLRFQTQWLHCTMQNISHCTDSDPDPYSLFLCGTEVRVRFWQCKWPIMIAMRTAWSTFLVAVLFPRKLCFQKWQMIRNSFDFEENIGSNQEYKMYKGSEPKSPFNFMTVKARWQPNGAAVGQWFHCAFFRFSMIYVLVSS